MNDLMYPPDMDDCTFLEYCQRMTEQEGFVGESRDAFMLLALSKRYGVDLERIAGLAHVRPERAVTIASRYLAAGVWQPDGTVLFDAGWLSRWPLGRIVWHCWVLTGIGAMVTDPEHPGEFKLTDRGLDMAKALVAEVAL